MMFYQKDNFFLGLFLKKAMSFFIFLENNGNGTMKMPTHKAGSGREQKIYYGSQSITT